MRIEEQIEDVRRDHRYWSDETFGRDAGPVGPLKHLASEAEEAAENPLDIMEYADCYFLLWDALHRSGFTRQDLYHALKAKLAINRLRKWPEPKDGEPREHVKED